MSASVWDNFKELMQTLSCSLAQAHMGFEVLPNLHWGCREDSPEKSSQNDSQCNVTNGQNG